jgi:hypothetical protein
MFFVMQTAVHNARRYDPLYLCKGWTAKEPRWGTKDAAQGFLTIEDARDATRKVAIPNPNYEYDYGDENFIAELKSKISR